MPGHIALNTAAPLPESVDSKNKFEDLSGIDATAYENPYDALIEASQGDPGLLQSRYSAHRTTRNSQQKAKLLSPEFTSLITDPILQRLVDPSIEPGFTDPRHCLVFWARPPSHIRSLAGKLQQKLLELAPNLWLMPVENMHLTALEIIHSVSNAEAKSLIDNIGPATIAAMTDYTFSHRTRLLKPMLSYDAAAIALSFLPAAGESLPVAASDSAERTEGDDNFTYHHLRRDLYNIARKTGVNIGSRYVVPSSHITIGRFLRQDDHDSPEKMKLFVKGIEEINEWLEKEYWPKQGEDRRLDAEWIVGQEKGLDCREGTLWYGGGRTVRLGKGF